MTRKTLEDLQVRCIKRGVTTAGIVGHVRAELDRLATKIRAMNKSKLDGKALRDPHILMSDVLKLIREAKK